MDLVDLAARRDIALEALDPARNCRRRYRIERSRDLFGHEIIDLSWGRIGTSGQSMRLSAPTPEQAVARVRVILARRASARCRIGVAYRPR